MSRETYEAERALLVRTWRATFDFGGEHHTKVVRDEGTVDHIAYIVEDADRTDALSLPIVAEVVWLLIRGHPFMDCNHRTAAVYLLALMVRLGSSPQVPDSRIAEFLREVDSRRLSREEVERWLYASFA